MERDKRIAPAIADMSRRASPMPRAFIRQVTDRAQEIAEAPWPLSMAIMRQAFQEVSNREEWMYYGVQKLFLGRERACVKSIREGYARMNGYYRCAERPKETYTQVEKYIWRVGYQTDQADSYKVLVYVPKAKSPTGNRMQTTRKFPELAIARGYIHEYLKAIENNISYTHVSAGTWNYDHLRKIGDELTEMQG